MNKILCLGEALIDMICTDRDVRLSDGQNFLKKAGGAPTNVAAAIAALGGKVSLAAKVGNDPFGDHLAEVMKGFGVDTQWMLRDPHHFTTFAFVSLMGTGERDFVFNRGADGQLSTADLEGLQLENFSVVHFGSATGFLPGPFQQCYQHFLQAAKSKNAFVSFDPNYRQLLFPESKETFITQSRFFLEQCDFFKVSDEEALLLTGAGNLDEAIARMQQDTSAVFAITVGADGTLLRVGNDVQLVPSIAIKPIDTTGAGDAFVGALLYQLSVLERPEIQSMTYEHWAGLVANANKAGARTCEYLGAMEAFKHLSAGIFA